MTERKVHICGTGTCVITSDLLFNTSQNGPRRWNPGTEPSAAAVGPRGRAAAGLHGQVQRGLSAEHAAGQPAAAEGDFTEKHYHRSDSQHQRP